MAMVKAFSYGSGGAEIASVLQFHNVDYLGVAYADEGVELVKAGISLPVMVMNAEPSSFQSIVDYNLQPVIYSMSLFHSFENYIREQGLTGFPVHVEVETGMNRLGFAVEEIEQLSKELSVSGYLQVISVFSHLAASEDPLQNSFTAKQYEKFKTAADLMAANLSYSFMRHISNSAAIIMHPALQGDMVRLGIGLYGIEVDPKEVLDLHPVASLRSTIAQIRKVSMGETISYNRSGAISRDSIIGTVRIGYADGYSRQFSNGKGKMLVRGQLVPVVGSVCMDMTMIDLTGIEGVQEGDDVLIFGNELPVQTIASWIGTIPYEIMAGISQRVKRVYFHE
jgi:Alr-MurF fusion protein